MAPYPTPIIMSRVTRACFLIGVACLTFSLTGCGIWQHARRAPLLEQTVAQLQANLEAEQAAHGTTRAELHALKATWQQNWQDLEGAREALERELHEELAASQAKLEMTERGLTVTLLDELLFDSGKTEIREDGQAVLDAVGTVMNEKISEGRIAVEGHTDDEPITHSGWRSNWELSTARATSVVHYLITEHQIDPERLLATGYGEFQPVALNDTPEGRQENRRVEIVLMPGRPTREASFVSPHSHTPSHESLIK